MPIHIFFFLNILKVKKYINYRSCSNYKIIFIKTRTVGVLELILLNV